MNTLMVRSASFCRLGGHRIRRTGSISHGKAVSGKIYVLYSEGKNVEVPGQFGSIAFDWCSCTWYRTKSLNGRVYLYDHCRKVAPSQ